MANWLSYLKSASKTSLVQDGKRKIHYTFDDGNEMVEEYSLSTYDLLVRKHKKKSVMGKEGGWDFEVGQDLAPIPLNNIGLFESNQNPMLLRKDSKDSFQWRIRNLPYSIETYSVNVDEKLNCILVKTSNKKYYKQLHIPDMERMKLKLKQDNLFFTHANNTLVIRYMKPQEVLEHEKRLVQEMKKKKQGEGDVDMCSPS